MRLWSFQSVDIMNDILHSDIWFSDISKAKRAWDSDKELLPDPKHAPIYCFGSGYRGAPLSLTAFKDLWRSFNTWYDFSLDAGERFMLELEVPEAEVLGARVTADGDNLWDYVYSDYKKFIRSTSKTVEVVLPYIRKNWIVCYRKFYYSSMGYTRFVCDTMETIVLKEDAFPLWNGMVDLTTDGMLFDSIRTQDVYRQELAEGTGEYPSEKDLIMRHGMDGCPRYFTIREAAECCNKQTINKIYTRLAETGQLKSVNDNMTVMDLFPDGLPPIGVNNKCSN